MTAEEAGERKGGPGMGTDWLTIRQACKQLGISRPTLYHFFEQGLLHRYRRGPRFGRIWLRREEVEALAGLILKEGEEKS